MNLHTTVNNGLKVGVVATLLFATSGIKFQRAQADEWNQLTILTISEPIQVTKTVLEPGTYVFKLLDSKSNRNIVQIFNADQTHLITTVLAFPHTRFEDQLTGDSRFTFYETPAGHPKALHTWFYPGELDGQEFPYPKKLAVLTAAAVPAPRALPTPEPTPAAVPEPQEQAQAPAPEPAPQSVEPQPQTEIAQVTPPPPAEQPVEAPAPPPAAAAQLPKTATPFPLFGLGGLFSLGAYGLMRVRRFV